MRAGYKDTKIGEIPEDWKVRTLKSFCNLITKQTGFDYSATIKPNLTNNPDGKCLPMLQTKNFQGRTLSLNTDYFIPSEIAKMFPKILLDEKCLLFSIVGASVGNVGLYDGKKTAFLGGAICVSKFINIGEVDYVYYFAVSELGQKQIRYYTKGGGQATITIEDIRKLAIPSPPLPEQQKIAEILSTVDDKIDVIDQQISETQDLKKGLMQRLLTKGIGHTEFKDSPLGEIPKSWEINSLLKHIDLLSGFAFKSNAFNEAGKGTKLLRGINISTGKLRWNSKIDKWWDLPFEDYEKYSAISGDLVISMDGSLVGRNFAMVSQEDLPLLIVQRVARLRAMNTLSLIYLYHIIGSPIWLNFVDAVKTSSGIPHISAKNIKEFRIPFPPLSEQHKIADILSTVDEKIDILIEKKTHYQELKKGLMQQLLTGKIRVNGLIDKP